MGLIRVLARSAIIKYLFAFLSCAPYVLCMRIYFSDTDSEAKFVCLPLVTQQPSTTIIRASLQLTVIIFDPLQIHSKLTTQTTIWTTTTEQLKVLRQVSSMDPLSITCKSSFKFVSDGAVI
jgi:hypothetical protein